MFQAESEIEGGRAPWGAAYGTAWGAAYGTSRGAAYGRAWGAAYGTSRGAAYGTARGAAYGTAWGPAYGTQWLQGGYYGGGRPGEVHLSLMRSSARITHGMPVQPCTA